jgi:hypothetical protein
MPVNKALGTHTVPRGCVVGPCNGRGAVTLQACHKYMESPPCNGLRPAEDGGVGYGSQVRNYGLGVEEGHSEVGVEWLWICVWLLDERCNESLNLSP